MKTLQTRKIFRADGAQEELSGPQSIGRISDLIGADTLDTVNMRDRYVMLVDDAGIAKNLPINAEATRRYHAVCRPGTTHQIRGDVVIAPDADFAR